MTPHTCVSGMNIKYEFGLMGGFVRVLPSNDCAIVQRNERREAIRACTSKKAV
jgi:hypothetical protein